MTETTTASNTKAESKYGSRKYHVVLYGMTLGAGLAALGMLDANGALVLGGGMGAYTYFNVKEKENGHS